VEKVRLASRCRLILALIVFGIFCGALRCAACSYVIKPTKVAQSFTAKVLDYRERPFGNVELVLTKDEREVGRYKTSDDGTLLISELSPGNYELGPADPIRESGGPSSVSLVVSKARAAQRQVTLHWPTGLERLRNGTFRQEEVTPVADTQVELFRLPSRELVAKTQTDAFGYFDFPVLKEGMYYIRFKSGVYVEMIFLDLDSSLATSVSKLDVVIGNVIICDNAPRYYSLSGKETHATP
jgi:5-hydroxyisourate hydrolase-like protein (transthyretin family)